MQDALSDGFISKIAKIVMKESYLTVFWDNVRTDIKFFWKVSGPCALEK